MQKSISLPWTGSLNQKGSPPKDLGVVFHETPILRGELFRRVVTVGNRHICESTLCQKWTKPFPSQSSPWPPDKLSPPVPCLVYVAKCELRRVVCRNFPPRTSYRRYRTVSSHYGIFRILSDAPNYSLQKPFPPSCGKIQQTDFAFNGYAPAPSHFLPCTQLLPNDFSQRDLHLELMTQPNWFVE